MSQCSVDSPSGFEYLCDELSKLQCSSSFIEEFELLKNSFNKISSVSLYASHDSNILSVNENVLLINAAAMYYKVGDAVHIYISQIVNFFIKNEVLEIEIDLDRIRNYSNTVRSYQMDKETFRVCVLFEFFMSKSINKKTKPITRCEYLVQNYHGCNLRFGSVELRLIKTFLTFTSSEFSVMVQNVFDNIADENYMYYSSTSIDVDIGDAEYTIRQVITNAGVYGRTARDLELSIINFCNLYIDAMVDANEIYVSKECFFHANICRSLITKTVTNRMIKFGEIADIYKIFDGKKILFISPYATKCAENVNSGALVNQWRSLAPSCFELIPLDAFITTWPFNPHSSWNETLELMLDSVDSLFDEFHIDLVVASCGSYGVPLLHSVHKKYAVDVMYYGNYIHIFFGMLMNDYKTYLTGENLDDWLVPNLPEVNSSYFTRIDNGRYVYSG